MKRLAAITAAALLGMGVSSASADNHEACGLDLTSATPDATISGEISSIGFLAGVRWGEGELVMKDGTKREFDIVGLKLVETGAATVTYTGEVYNLKNVADFEGTYYGAGTKIAIIKGKGEGVMNNSSCVVIKGRGKAEGVQASAPAPGGVQISFDD